MPPADPAALASAIATVRNHWAEPERYSAVYLPALELIARHHLALLDAVELVRVRGLEWKLCNRTSIKTFIAKTIFGDLKVQSKYFWFANDGGGSGFECKSIADGKVKAEAHYRDRLAAALEPLIPTETAS